MGSLAPRYEWLLLASVAVAGLSHDLQAAESCLARSWPQLPIIFFTGGQDPQAQQLALAARSLALLNKPSDDHLLLDAIASAA